MSGMAFGQCERPSSDDLEDFGNQGDFFTRVAKGLVPGHKIVIKFGYNPNIANGNYEDIWDEGGKYNFQTTAQTLNISSNDNDDRPGDTGAERIEIEGLDASFNEISEQIDLNGTSTVTTTNAFLRVFRMKVLTAGSTGTNDGDITAEYSSTGDTAAVISDRDGGSNGENQTLMAIYTVPAGKTGYIYRWWHFQENNDNANIKLRVRPENEVFQVKAKLRARSPGEQRYAFPLKIEPKSDVLIEAESTSNNAQFSAGFDILLVDN